MPLSAKIIVTSVSALKKKYGTKAVTKIKAAVRALAAADKARGFATTLVDLSGAAAMKRVKGKPVAQVSDEPATKAAIDAIYHASTPDYLMILGASDVVVQQTLENPVPTVGPDADPDANVPSDLPYACEATGTRASAFLSPTRVVGRLPDLVGSSDPQYMLDLLKVATNAVTGAAADYASGFGVSAAVWKGSTALSLRNLFGTDTDLQLVPPKGADWAATLLHRRAHFINCHGADADAHFYGQSGNSFPIAFDAARLPAAGLDRVLVAAECCYGGQLYDPVLSNGQPNVACTYLRAGAYAFFGSSTVAYGPAEGNGSADLICQYFLRSAVQGASTGRAALEARQRFIRTSGSLDPTDLKTLIQYVLLGDPSIHPVAPPHQMRSAHVVPDQERTLRREALAKQGAAIGAVAGSARRAPSARPSRKTLAALQAELGGTAPTVVASYDVIEPTPKGLPLTRGIARGGGEKRFHLAMRRDSKAPDKQVRIDLVVATEVDGQVAQIKRLESR